MLIKGCYQISIVLAFLCGRAKTISIRYVRCVCFFENEKKNTHSPFSKIFEYAWTGRHTLISTSTVAFAHYTHRTFLIETKLMLIVGETYARRLSFPRTFRRIFLTLLDNVTLLVESLRQVVFKVSLSVDVWTKIFKWLPDVYVYLSFKCCGVFEIGIM